MPSGVYERTKKRGGWKLLKETKVKIGEAQRGENNYGWKGDNVGYRGIHLWLQRNKENPNRCEHCDKTGAGHHIHWANRDHKYSRNLHDYISLCPKCHGEYDKKNGLRKRKNSFI